MSHSVSFSPPSFRSSQDEFVKQSKEIFDSFGRLAVTGSIISGVVMIIAIAAVVYAIIECLKKAGTAISAYSQIPTSEQYHNASMLSLSPPEIAIAIPPDSQTEFATMKEFISNMDKEKLVRVTPAQLEEITNSYSTKLGSGGYGIVYKGELSNRQKVAVKVLKSFSMGIEEQFKAEVSTLGRTHHINLVRLFGYCFHPDNRALVYEFVENGSLNNFLFDSLNRETEVDKLQKIAVGTAKGIAYLHEGCQQRIIHYDIKPENILLDKNLEPRVADFGLAKLCNRESNNSIMTQFRGTKGYAAPEMGKPHPVTYKCDVYSFGILVFEIVCRRRHFDRKYSKSEQWLPTWAWDMFENNKLEMMLSLCGIEEKDREKAKRMLMVALWCVQYLPEDRPLMSTVVMMLESDTEIPPPRFPFPHLVSCDRNGIGSREDAGTSGSRQTDSSVQSGSKLKGHVLEIEEST